MGTRTASPRGRYGERLSVTRVWRYIFKNTTCWPATAHDVTTGVPQYKCRREITSSAFFVFTDWSVWRNVHSGRNTVFLYLSWRALARRLRLCVDPCPRYLTPDDTHDRCVFCLGEEHARDVFEGAICVHCEKLRSRLSLFSRKEGQPSASRDSIPTAAEARRRLKSRGSQLDMADELEKDRPFSRASAENESELLDCDDAIFWHHQIQRLVLCWVMPRKSRRCLRVRKLRLNPLNPPALHMNEFLEVMDHKNKSFWP